MDTKEVPPVQKGTKQLETPIMFIPLHIKEDLASLDEVANNKSAYKQTIVKLFDKADDPYSYFLDLIFYSNTAHHNKISFRSSAILSEFESWLKSKTAAPKPQLCHKVNALSYAMRVRNGNFIHKVSRILKMDKSEPELKKILDYHLSVGQLKQVCYAIEALKMQYDYTFDEVYFPLLFHDMRPLIISCLHDCKDLQLEFVKKLDDLYCNKETLNTFIASLKSRFKIKSQNHHDLKWLKKTLGHFINEWNIPVSECRNLERSRSYGAMSYLLHKRYTEKSMNDQSFQELMITTIKDDAEIQKELLINLVCLNEKQMALSMAKKLDVHTDNWPNGLIEFANEKTMSDSVNVKVSDTEETWDVEILNLHPPDFYLCLRLDESDILLVDDLQKFDSCVDILSNCYDVLGVDAEWRPCLGLSKEMLSLLQIATWDNIYLIDVLSLLKCLSPSHWNKLMEGVFYNPKILKLGYGVQRDLCLLIENFSHEAKSKDRFTRVLDFVSFWSKLTQHHADVLSNLKIDDSKNEEHISNEIDSRGLSGLCQQVLGKPLNKTEQFSDWEQRPLRKAQLTYAALDAFCLLQVYEKLNHVFIEAGLSLEKAIENFFCEKTKKPESKKKKNIGEKKIMEQQMKRGEKCQAPLPISKFRVVVDCCFSGLGKHLRIRGADVVITKDGSDALEAVKIAQREERFIITNTRRYEMMKGYMPEGMVYCAPCTVPLSQQASFVCRYFNIVCSEDDVFSRCTLCNCDHYLKVKSCDMELLWKIWCTSPPTSSPHTSEETTVLEPFVVCDGGFITESGIMHTGVSVDMSGLSETILINNALFYVCSQCGKLYWEGSHHKRTKEAVAKWITANYSSQENEELFPVERSSKSHIDNKTSLADLSSARSPEKNSQLTTLSSQPLPTDDKAHKVKELCEEEFSDDDDDHYDMVYSW